MHISFTMNGKIFNNNRTWCLFSFFIKIKRTGFIKISHYVIIVLEIFEQIIMRQNYVVDNYVNF